MVARRVFCADEGRPLRCFREAVETFAGELARLVDAHRVIDLLTPRNVLRALVDVDTVIVALLARFVEGKSIREKWERMREGAN